MDGYRRFCNKIWQGTRFMFMQLGADYRPTSSFQLTGAESPVDRWILSRLALGVQLCDQGFRASHLQQATTAVYNFWLYEFCDVYLEAVKPVIAAAEPQATATVRAVLYLCVDTFLRLLSPFMPFITEELWQRLPKRSTTEAPSLCLAEYPRPEQFAQFRSEQLEASLATAMSIVGRIRSLRTDKKTPPKQKLAGESAPVSESFPCVVSAFIPFVFSFQYSKRFPFQCSCNAPTPRTFRSWNP